MVKKKSKAVAIVVAHPDDETLWSGGTILSHRSWQCFIACLCRKSDKERSLRFYNALKIFKSEGIMGDLDDGPEQKPLETKEIKQTILKLLPRYRFDLIITHNPAGEYTRHLRHEEISNAVIQMWYAGKISANELWTFAYEDGNKDYYPRPVEKAAIYQVLTKQIWAMKYSIITDTYGFEKDSFEAKTTPKTEAFWQFTNPHDAREWLKKF
jgi:LmbE family N-acetylglucosaminyl deacetylase